MRLRGAGKEQEMRLRYHQLVGKHVRTADGHGVGRIADLHAEPVGDELRVTALLVGPAALIRRVSFRRGALFPVAPPRVVPWSAVARLDEEVHLRLDRAAWERVGKFEAPPAPSASEEIPT